MSDSKNKNRLERFVYNKLTSANSYINPERHNILTVEEHLKQIKRNTFLKASLTGALAIIFLYLPYYIYPEWFPDTQVWVPLMEKYYAVPLLFLIYSLVLVILEVALLTLYNIAAIKNISQTYGYPNPKDKHYESDVNALVAVGLERKQKGQAALGINPFEGLFKFQVLTYTALNLMKAALTNFLFKLIVRRLLGRYALRIFVDLAGVPIYAFWNSWAANRVMNETRVRVMAAPVIKDLTEEIFETQKENQEFQDELYYILDYIAIVKRTFHYNHYLLSLSILEKFSISIDAEHQYDSEFINRIKNGSKLTQSGFSKLLLFGMLIDGKLSKKEEFLIYKMNKHGYFFYNREQSKVWTKDYFMGRGIRDLIHN
tara:strand:- start:73 stop:1188 length:1116 start_codon:yes stop_codon:yes gene_type:complete